MTPIRDPLRPPTHPGVVLGEDVLPALGMSIIAAADKIGVSRQTLHRIIAGTHPVTPAMALRLGKFCGNGPNLWLNMQQACDLWHVEREIAADIAKISTRRAL